MDPLLAEVQTSLKETIPADPAPTPATDPVAPVADPPAPSAEPAAPSDPAAPVVDPTPEPAPAAPVDYTKYLQEKSGGRIASEEELTKIIQERDSLEEQLKKSPEMDDYTLKLSAWRQKGYDVELFHTIHDLPIDELSSEDKVKASLKLQNPDWAETDINLFVKNKYGILAPEEDGYEENKARYGKLQLDVDAKSADQDLRQLQGMTEFSQEDEQEANRVEGVRQQAWTAGLPKISADFGKVSFSLDTEGKQVFDYVPTPQQKQAVINAIQKAVLNAPLAYDESGVKTVNDAFRKEFINQNINDIVRAAASRMASIEKEANIKKVHNPSAVPPAPIAPAPADAGKAILDTIDGFMDKGGRR